MILRHARPVALGPGPAAPVEPVDVRLIGGRVAAVGAGLTAEPGEEVHDLDGAWVAPGLWDAHVHLGQWVRTAERLDLSATTSVTDVLTLVAARAAEQPGAPVVGWGHRPGEWSPVPGVTALDALGLDVPVVLVSGDAHHAWVNSLGLRALGLPPREGMVAEGEWFDAYARLDARLGLDAAGPDAYRRVMQRATAMGVVGVVDLEFGETPASWGARWDAGADLLTVRVATYADGLDAVLASGARSGDLVGGRAGLETGPFKIISDGSLGTLTAWCCEPYAAAGAAQTCGAPNQSTAELRDLLTRAHAGGLEVAVHAIGDRAVAEALDVLAETGARGSIEHAQLTTHADVRRMADLGIRASVQPAHLVDDRDLSDLVWPGQGGRSFPLRWMVDAGVDVRLGSDAPVAPLDPWLAIAAAVHRSADDRDAWHPEQAVSVREALAASTDGWGTVAAGHPGDLVVLSGDPTAVDDVHALRRFGREVLATYVRGRRVWG